MSQKQQVVESKAASPSLFAQAANSTQSFLKQMAQRPLAFTGMLIVIFYLIIALIGSSIAPYNFPR